MENKSRPTIPVAAADRLFHPFRFLAADRTSRSDGLDLGPSIVQAIANAHSAAITAGNQEVASCRGNLPNPQSGTPAAHACANPHGEFTVPVLTAPRPEPIKRRPS
jgi:hypothetical protein